jgi:hypothetical protein
MGDAADDLELREAGLEPFSVKIPGWKTRDGKVIAVRDMETSHIQNCIRMLRRNIASRPDPYAYGEPEGDAAQDAFNAGIRHDDYMEEQMRKQIEVFEKELKRRQ